MPCVARRRRSAGSRWGVLPSSIAACLVIAVGLTLPAAAHADARVTLRPSAGPAGTLVELRGTGFGRVGEAGRASGQRTARGSPHEPPRLLPRQPENPRVGPWHGHDHHAQPHTSGTESLPRHGARRNAAPERAGHQHGTAAALEPEPGRRRRTVKLRGSGFEPRKSTRARFAGAGGKRTRSNPRGRLAIDLIAPRVRRGSSRLHRTSVTVHSGKTKLNFGFTVTGPARPLRDPAGQGRMACRRARRPRRVRRRRGRLGCLRCITCGGIASIGGSVGAELSLWAEPELRCRRRLMRLVV